MSFTAHKPRMYALSSATLMPLPRFRQPCFRASRRLYSNTSRALSCRINQPRNTRQALLANC